MGKIGQQRGRELRLPAAARKEENGRLYFDGLTLLCQIRRDNIAIEEWGGI